MKKPGFHAQGMAVFLVVAAASLVLMGLALVRGELVAQSSFLNVNWAAGFAGQLAQGEFYPRWLPDMNNGMGSAVFYFYGPLPFYLTAPVVLLTGNASLSVVIGSTVMLGLSGISGYALFRRFTGVQDSLITAVIYMVMPYHFVVDIWGRAAYGEQAAFIFMPLASLCILNLQRGSRHAAGLALSCAGLTLSHLPSMLIFSPVMAFLSLWTAYRLRSFRVLFLAAASGILGIGAASIYVLPALTSRWLIKPEFWLTFQPADYLLLLRFSESFDFILLLCFSVTLAVFAAAVFSLRKHADFRELHPWIVIAIAVLFLVSPLSAFVWRNAGIFIAVQFPWRMLSVMELATAVAIAAYFKHMRETAIAMPAMPMPIALGRIAFLLAVTAAGAAGAMRMVPVDFSSELVRAADRENLALKADALEYLPSCLTVDPQLVAGTAATTELLHSYADLPTPASALRKFYYPFLQVYSQGRELPASCDPGTGFIRVEGLPADLSGVSIVRRSLPIERPAWIVTSISIILIGLLAAWPARRRRAFAGA